MKTRSPLGQKLFAVLLCGLVISYSLLVYLVTERQTELLLAQSVATAGRFADNLSMVLKESMNQANPDLTVRLLEKAGNDLINIDVTDPSGSRVFIRKGSVPLPAALRGRLEPLQEIKEDEVIFYMPLRNGPDCRRCHQTGEMRGHIIVRTSIKGVRQEISATRNRLILYGLLVLTAGGLLLYIVVNRFITRPFRNLITAINAFQTGDFKYSNWPKGNDEFLDVAEAFNSMGHRITVFNNQLEEMVRGRTAALEKSTAELREKTDTLLTYGNELKTVASFSYRFACRNSRIGEVLQKFSDGICSELGYTCTEIYLIHRYTEGIERTAQAGEKTEPLSQKKLWAVISSDGVTTETDSVGRHMLYIPIHVPAKGHCWEINQCKNKVCLAYGVTERRCWKISKTRECRDRHTGNLLHCFQCDAFTCRGLLVIGSVVPYSDHALHTLELAAMEIAYTTDMYELLGYERNMVNYLKQVNRTSAYAMSASGIPHMFSLLSSADILVKLFDGMALWLFNENGACTLTCSNIEGDADRLDLSRFLQENIPEHPVEQYSIGIGDYHSAIVCPLINGNRLFGVMAFFKKFRRLLRPEEKAVAILVTQQVSYNIENIMLHGDLETQNMELIRQKKFTQQIFNSITSGIIVIDRDKTVLAANPYALQTFLVDEKEILGMNLDGIAPEFLGHASSGRHEGFFEVRGGKILYIGFTLSDLHNGGSTSGQVILFRDLTEIMSLRKQLRRREYFSAIGEMASWIAHEVRNPLFAIASMARIIRKQAVNPDQDKFAGSIIKETTRLNLLVEDLLQYGKPMELLREHTDFNTFLSDILESMSSFAAECGCVIETTPSPSGVHVSIDRNRVKQVVINILKNAMEAGAKKITIGTECFANGVRITVHDNGMGIEPPEIGKIFTPFFTTKKEGTGLGLAVCKKIVEEHGGAISIESRPETGTDVLIEIFGYPEPEPS